MCKPTNEKKLTNEFGVTFSQLREFVNSIDFIPDDPLVYVDIYSSPSEHHIKEMIADEEGLTIYDWTTE